MASPAHRRLLVVSHPAVVAANQAVFAELVRCGIDLHLVTPATWEHAYDEAPFDAATDPALIGRHTRLRVLGRGAPQRHVYLGRIVQFLRRQDPDVCYIEEECFSLPALQWALVAHRLRIPFGIQAWENLDRPLPRPARWIRRYVLSRASFIVARTPAAKAMVEQWGTSARVVVVPSPVPSTDLVPRVAHDGFVVGIAGRLVPEKNPLLVAEAVQGIDGASLVAAGDGPLRASVEQFSNVEVRTDFTHTSMANFFASCDVVCLVSRPTPTWAEQFGRVLVEALAQETPVIGSRCGEIPWVIECTGGGVTVEVDDLIGLREALTTLRDDPERRRSLGRRGREAVVEHFSVPVAARGLAQVAGLGDLA
jgi:glycosyltransferase involved in cell wall biosynthesis